MIVQKYGGSSVASIEKIEAIAQNIKQTVKEKLIVVVSAMGKTTNNLISLAQSIQKEPNKRELDHLLSTGEQQSASLMAMALQKVGVDAISLNGIEAGIKTTKTHGKALIKSINTKKLFSLLQKHDCLVITGFQGCTHDGTITTLGRGGSDTTATAIASAMNAKCEIYTDVEAIYSVNPARHKNAKKLNELSFNTVLEMASAGAKVLDERAIEVAKKYGTKIYLGKTLCNDHSKGTYVMDKNFMEQVEVKNISVRENVCLMKLETQKISQVIFVLQKLNQNLEMLTINEDIISFICKKEHQKTIENALKDIQNLKVEKILEEISRITLVGYGFATHPQIVCDMLTKMECKKIDILHLVQTETTLSFLVKKEKEKETIKTLVSLYKL